MILGPILGRVFDHFVIFLGVNFLIILESSFTHNLVEGFRVKGEVFRVTHLNLKP